DGVAQLLPVARRGHEDPEDQPPAEHDLLDVEHLDAGAGEGAEHRRAHPRAVLPGDGQQEGLRQLVRHGGSRLSRPRGTVGGGPYRVDAWQTSQHPDTTRSTTSSWPLPTSRPRRPSTPTPWAGASPTTARRTPASSGPAVRARSVGSTPSGRRGQGSRSSCSTATTSTPPSPRSGMRARPSTRSPSSSRA